MLIYLKRCYWKQEYDLNRNHSIVSTETPILLIVFRRMHLSFQTKGREEKIRPYELSWFGVTWKLWLNLLPCEWLRSKHSLVKSLIPLQLWQLKIPFGDDLINFFKPLHKKRSFPFTISSENVTKSAGNCRFCHIYRRNP